MRFARWVIREPFFQFLALGLVIWLATGYIQSLNGRYVIHLGPVERARLASTYQQQYGQPPTADQLQQLIEHYVTEEIYLREGLALNLDKNDEIVRRRIAQKFEFLQTDLAAAPEPSAGELEAWFQQNAARYTTPARVTFTHLYFSTDRDGDDGARARAATALASRPTPSAGDPFPGPTEISALTPDAAQRLFGVSDLTEQVFTAPVQKWFGPVRSGYGWHLVYINARQSPEAARFEDVRSPVLKDYLDAQQQQLNAQAFAKLRAKYTIVAP